jgi:uncharacterized membrane protein
MEEKNLGKTSIGMEANIAALLCYLAGWITGLIFYLVEKENKFVRFHAMQSIVTFGGLSVIMTVLSFIPIIGWILLPLAGLLWFVLWIVLMVKAFKGEKIKLPFAGDIAEKNS